MQLPVGLLGYLHMVLDLEFKWNKFQLTRGLPMEYTPLQRPNGGVRRTYRYRAGVDFFSFRWFKFLSPGLLE